jgi:hypothetical protein
MTTMSISVDLPSCNTHAVGEPTQAGRPRVANEVFWRKQLILRRGALEVQWHALFPYHNFADLRLISPNPADSYWSGESWKRAARSYHEDRKRVRL